MRNRFWLILYVCLIVVLFQNTLFAQENTSITLNLQDQLLIDQDGDGLADPGDTIRYTANVTNCGTNAAENVQMNANLDTNTTLKPGSVPVSAPQTAGCPEQVVNTPVDPTSLPNPPVATPVDPTIPSVTATTPANASTEVALGASLSITFSEAVTTTGDWFQIICTVSGTFNLSSANVTAAGGPITFMLDPNIDFQVGESCTVTIVAAQVQAQDNNAAMVTDHVFSFTTETPPTITATTPVNGATAVNSANDIGLTFDEAVNISAASFNLECPAGTPFAGGFAVAGAGTNTITINPTGNLPAGTNCQVVSIAANISDVDANDPPDLLDGNGDNIEGDDYTFSFTTDVDSAPSVQTIVPANGAVSIATNTTITITFDEAVDIASAAAFSLECPAGTPIGYTITTPATLPASTTSVVITPAGNLPDNTICTVTVFAAQVADTDTNDPPDNMAANFTSSFTTEAPPTVTGTTPANAATGVANNSNIVINFDEPVTVTTASFTLGCPVGTPVAFAVLDSGTSSITLDPTVNLPATTTCAVTVVAAQVSDLDVIDPPDTMTADYTFTFDTGIGDVTPTVNQAGILPASTGGVNTAALNAPVSTTPAITIPFSEPVNAAAGAFTLACPANTPVTVTPALPALNQNSLVVSPTTPLTEGANCTLTVVAANISDTDTDDPPDLMAANYTITFTVDTAPAETLTETEVGNVFQNVTGAGATNVDLDSDIRITFNEPVNVTVPATALQCPAGNNIATAVTGNGTAILTLNPNVNLPVNTNCVLNIPAANITDVDTADAPDTATAAVNHSFQTANDNAPTVMTNPANGGGNVAVNSNITVVFNEPVTLTGGWFGLACSVSGNRVSTGELTGTGITIIENTPDLVYTIDPTADLAAGDICTITIDPANVVDNDPIDPPNELDGDASGDVVDGDADDYVAVFSTTDMPPQVNTATSTPANGATVPNNQTVTLNFTETVDIAAGGITWQCGVTNITFTPALPQNNVTTFTLTPGAILPSDSTCTVTLESTLITDNDPIDPPNQLDGDASGDLVDGDADDFILNFTVDAPPAPVTISVDVGGVPQFLPLLGGQTVDLGSDIRLTFTEPVDATAAGVILQCPVGTPITFTGLPATNTNTLTLNPTGNLPASTTCRLTLVQTEISDTDLIDPPNALDGNGDGVEGDSVFITFTTQDTAVDDAYTVTPNLTYVSPTGVRANDTPTTVTITGFGATLGTANGTVPNGTNFITAGGAGGRVVMNTDGTFTFYPDAGDDNTAGTVTFFYTIVGGSTAQVTLTFEAEELVWFVDGTGGTCVGTGTNVGTQACPATDMVTTVAASHTANDIIFIDSGPYQCGITLQNDVMVIGNGSSSTLTALAASRVTPVAGSNFAPYDSLNGVDPTLNSAAADCLTLGQNNTLRGFTIANTGNFAGIIGTNYGTLTITEFTDNGTGQMLVLNTGTINATFDALTSTLSDNTFSPIEVQGSTITGFTVLGGTTITNPAFHGIFLANNLGAGGFSFGNTTITRAAATAGAGVILGNGAAQNNPVTFLSLAITNGNGPGLVGNEQQGDITVTNNTGSISTTGGAAIDISRITGNTPVDLNFDQISATNSPTYGIRLDNVAGTGVTVSGNITLTLTPAATSGILLENITAGAFSFTPLGTINVIDRQNEGIFLNNVNGGSVAFGNTTINNNTGATAAAIRGQQGTSSVTFAQVNIDQGNVGVGEAYVGAADTAPAATTGSGDAVYLNAMTGGMTFNGGTVQNAADDGFDIRASSNVTINGGTVVGRGTASGATSQGIQIYNGSGTYQMDNLTLQDVQGLSANSAVYVFTDVNNILTLDINNGTWTGNSAAGNNSTSGYGLFASSSAGTLTVDIDNTNFTDIAMMGVFVRGENTANITTRIQNADFNGTGVNGNNGISVNSIAAHTGTYQFQIANNTFTDVVNLGRAIAVLFQGTTNAAFTNSITGNTISQTAAGTANGILLQVTGNVDLNANVDTNAITNLSDNGIEVLTATAWTTGHTLNINVRNNTVGTVAQPVGQSGATLRNSAIFVQNQGAGTANIYVEDTVPNTLVSILSANGNDRGTVYISNLSTGDVNATVRGLNITNTGGDQNTFYGQNTGTGTTCLDIENTAANVGAGEFDIRQTAGTLNLRFVGNNPAATTTTGTIGATAGCTLPVVMAAPVYVQTFGADMSVAEAASPSLPEQIMDAVLKFGVDVAYAQAPATVTIPFGIIPPNSTVSATFDVVVNDNIPDGYRFVSIQGTLTGNGFTNLLSNDPDTQQANDPTNTPLDPLRNVIELPSTGEMPWWRNWVLMLAGLGVLTTIMLLKRRLRFMRVG